MSGNQCSHLSLDTAEYYISENYDVCSIERWSLDLVHEDLPDMIE